MWCKPDGALCHRTMQIKNIEPPEGSPEFFPKNFLGEQKSRKHVIFTKERQKERVTERF